MLDRRSETMEHKLIMGGLGERPCPTRGTWGRYPAGAVARKIKNFCDLSNWQLTQETEKRVSFQEI